MESVRILQIYIIFIRNINKHVKNPILLKFLLELNFLINHIKIFFYSLL